MSPILGARGGLAASAYGFTSAVAALGDYESIQTSSVGSGATAASLSFTSIASTYKHLQIRGIGRTNRPTPADMDGLLIQFNSDTAANYSDHRLFGDGSSAGSGADVSYTGIECFRLANLYVSNITMGVQIVDILDYADTNKYKTVRALGGVENNGSGSVALNSGSWRNTNAITTVTLKPATGSLFTQYTSFALYGIKG